MRNPDRISTVLTEIETLWRKHPDLRFGQMILCVVNQKSLFYVEDEQLLQLMTAYLDTKVVLLKKR
jgi:hypothetical protein